ncbi:uncharacterized protein C8A04DRAFT_33023 [Dichotomopilus funicola]|uniref:Uncharacterized protein n=1 Tax=Dichotomopilus funicola TaxID=1934379 RepID=A0AAN6UUL2_9PEZI|nr:hypothetical protein C8A04DRAFT_33023 [Dichotomopilus funicola]
MASGGFNGLRNLLPANYIKLGSFVLFPGDPLRSFFNPDGTPAPSAKIEATSAADFDASNTGGRGALSLGEILTAGCGLKSETSVNLEAASSTSQSMLNYDDWFQEACRSTKLRVWFEQQLERYGSAGLRLHFVIGLQTIKDASLVLRRSNTVEARLAGQVPVAELLGDPGVLTRLLDPKAEVNVEFIRSAGQKFSVAETVHAVRYALVRFEYLSSRKLARLLGKMRLPKSSLETGTRWVVMGADAGGPSVSDQEIESEDELEDIIEARICEQDEEQGPASVASLEVGGGYQVDY